MLRPSTAAAATVLLAVGLAVAPASPALAIGICDETAPLLDATVTCAVAGNTDVLVPANANYVWVEAAGGGGGASVTTGGAGAAGGNAATVSGWAELVPQALALKVVVGAGGSGAMPNPSLVGGDGGGGSGVFADIGQPALLDLVIAGGGGGAGGQDFGAGAGNGGDAEFQGGAVFDTTGGMPGEPTGVGGEGGATGSAPGTAGATYAPGTGVLADGGTGGVVGLRRGGNGGGGFGGGGGGSASLIGGMSFAGAGGGGGSSYLNPTYLSDTGGGVAGPAPAPGTGATTAGTAGLTGEIKLRFTTALPSTVTSVSPGDGSEAGGGTLTVTGTRLTGSTAVTVGGEACTPVTVVSATSLTCVLPAGTVTSSAVDVVVTTLGGDVTLAGAYTYLLAEPTIASVSPEAGPLAGTGTLTITGTFLADTSAITVNGAPCDPFTVSSATEITCPIPEALASGAVDVSVTTPGGTATLLGGYRYADEPTITTISPISGEVTGGGTLFVNGTALPGVDDQILVGGLACGSIGIVSATRVSCELPSSLTTGAVDVTVTTPGGTATLINGYEYVAVVVPTPTSSSPSPTPTPSPSSSSPSPTPSPTSASPTVTPTTTSPTVAPTTTSPSPSPTPTPSVTSSATPSPTPTATTSPSVTPTTPTPTTPAPTPTAGPVPTDEPATGTPARINLDVTLKVDSSVVGAPATLSGEGMRPNSTYVLTMYSTPVRLAAGRADDDGAFSATIRMPRKACVTAGLHELVLTGTGADGTALRDSSWIVMDDNCATRSQRAVKPTRSTVTLGSVGFAYQSAGLSTRSKSALRQIRGSLSNAKRVTVTGYTQTSKKSASAQKANRALAKKRALAVRKYLLSIGVKTRVVAVGAGGVKPLGKAQKYNRRVVVTVLY